MYSVQEEQEESMFLNVNDTCGPQCKCVACLCGSSESLS